MIQIDHRNLNEIFRIYIRIEVREREREKSKRMFVVVVVNRKCDDGSTKSIFVISKITDAAKSNRFAF